MFAVFLLGLIMKNLRHLIDELCRLKNETYWVEFKTANANPEMIGKNISALANSACAEGRLTAYVVWGVDDESHNIVGTAFDRYAKMVGQQEIESWLRNLLSQNAEFEFLEYDYDGKRVVILAIQAAIQYPVLFKKEAYIRVGSYTKRLVDYPDLQSKLWMRIRFTNFELMPAKENLLAKDIINLLNYQPYFILTGRPVPSEQEDVLHYLSEANIVLKQDDGRYSITNVGALLFALKLSDFPTVARKKVRIVQYKGDFRGTLLHDKSYEYGYASAFTSMLEYIEALTPSEEVIEPTGSRITKRAFPALAIRELLANALIHQDLTAQGSSVLVEIFAVRIEITNPGKPMVEIIRILDNPPKARNQILGDLMRHMRFCEELGSGWDRSVGDCEENQVPAPTITIYEEATKVCVYRYVPFDQMTNETKQWNCYLHASLQHMKNKTMTNKSLRERFDLPSTAMSKISRIIKGTLEEKLIKPVDPTTAPRHMQYLPFWA